MTNLRQVYERNSTFGTEKKIWKPRGLDSSHREKNLSIESANLGERRVV